MNSSYPHLSAKPELSKLQDGQIPPHTHCPFRFQCEWYCWHQGEEHEVSYSCAAARAFDFHQSLGLEFN